MDSGWKKLERINWPIVLAVATLLGLGVLFIWSGSLIRNGPDGDVRPFLKARKQMLWMAVGLVIMLLTMWPHYRRIVEEAYIVYAFCLGLLLLVLVLGALGLLPVINGARRWIPLGFFNFQPSELMKVGLVIVLARYLQFRSSYRRFLGLVVPFLLTLVPVLLIAKQPDLGTAMLLVPVLFACLFVAGARLRHLLFVLGMGVLAAPVAYFGVLRDYQQKRIVAFLNQSEVNSPSALDELYQLIQSKLAIGSGGWLGQGWGEGTMNRLNFLPERTTDFIFAVIGEEAGFVGLAFVLVLFFVIFASAFAVAERTRDPSGRLLVIGSTVILACQLYINTAMTVGLMPVTGVTLPLISYGGSSLITSFFLLGLILNVGMRPGRSLASDDFEFEDDRLRRRDVRKQRRWAQLYRYQDRILQWLARGTPSP